MLAVVRDTWDYVQQMIPLGLIALMILLLLRPMRKRRLKEQNLVSSLWRETALLLFVVFCAGLAALTLFPANLWAYVFDRLFCGKTYFRMVWGDLTWTDFYPSWEETVSQIPYLPNILTPFEEISRALNRKSYWLLFMLLGNRFCPRAAVEEVAVVEIPAGGLLHLCLHRVHPVLYRPKYRY